MTEPGTFMVRDPTTSQYFPISAENMQKIHEGSRDDDDDDDDTLTGDEAGHLASEQENR